MFKVTVEEDEDHRTRVRSWKVQARSFMDAVAVIEVMLFPREVPDGTRFSVDVWHNHSASS